MEKTVSGTSFTDKINNSTTYTGTYKGISITNGYDPNKTHKMTIFYMERGMSDSNLFIRYNFPSEANFSKMKVQEQTNFANVNPGLKTVTQKAADKDIFQYNIKNKGTNSANILHYNTKYPTKTATAYTRSVQGNDTTLVAANNSDGTSYYFSGSASATEPINVAGVSYNWVDWYASMRSNAGAGGKTDSGGNMYLWHGIAAGDTVLSPDDESKSSGEFEGQFERYSSVKITQGDYLYSAASGLVTPTQTQRAVDTYYTRTQSLFSTTHRTPVTLDDNGTTFNFRNDINETDLTSGDSTDDPDTGDHLDSAVAMTEQFVNTVNVGAISVTKNLDPDDNVQDEFEFQIQFTNVLGVPDVIVSDYSNVKYSKGGVDNLTLSSDGKFYLKKGETVTITGIPVGTHYVITESASTNYTQSSVTGNLTDDKTTTTQTATVVNTRRLGTLTLNKAVTGGAPAGSFTFTGTLTGPEGVNLSQYSISGTNVSLGTYDSNHNSYTFTASVTAGTPVVINNIPYGTTYTVNESGVTGTTSRTVNVNGYYFELPFIG